MNENTSRQEVSQRHPRVKAEIYQVFHRFICNFDAFNHIVGISIYIYSAKIVYNNFPWPEPTEQQKQKIEETAHGILDARALFPDSSLADLYDPLTMPVELRKAHIANDKAVMAAYGFGIKMTEEECVAELMKLYQKMQG